MCDIGAGILGHRSSFVCLGLLPRYWLPANEFAECTEARMWESSGYIECANNNLLVASDQTGGSRDTPKTLRQLAFGVDTSFMLQRIGFLGGQVPGRQTVLRAELWGAIKVLSRVDEKTNIQISG